MDHCNDPMGTESLSCKTRIAYEFKIVHHEVILGITMKNNEVRAPEALPTGFQTSIHAQYRLLNRRAQMTIQITRMEWSSECESRAEVKLSQINPHAGSWLSRLPFPEYKRPQELRFEIAGTQSWSILLPAQVDSFVGCSFHCALHPPAYHQR